MLRKLIVFFVFLNLVGSCIGAVKEPRRRKQQPPIVCFESIDQSTYEKNAKQNIYHGQNMCGLFATYNGLMMLDHARTGEQPTGERCKNIDLFNTWLGKNDQILKDIINDQTIKKGKYLGDLSADNIEALIKKHDSSVKKHDSSCKDVSIVIQWRDFEKALRGMYDTMKSFRRDKDPHLVIVHANNHWIAIVILEHETWCMDSFNDTTTTDPIVTRVDTLFRRDSLSSQRVHVREKRKRKQITPKKDPKDVVELSDSDDDADKSVDKNQHKSVKESEDKKHDVQKTGIQPDASSDNSGCSIQ